MTKNNNKKYLKHLSEKLTGQEYGSLIFKATELNEDRIMIGIPMTGLLRSEWVLARYGQCIPCNWSNQEVYDWMQQNTPIGWDVANARNIITHAFVNSKCQWLLFVDHDVCLPRDAFVKINIYMMEKKYPVVCGLYFAKCHPPEPLLYRGRGNGHVRDFKIGEKIWVDGIPMGLTLIHGSILRAMWNDAEWYNAKGQTVKKVFDTPSGVIYDPQTGASRTYAGTEDLAWCNRVIAGKYLEKAGWPEFQKKRYPFLADTSIFGEHVTNDGQLFPFPWSWPVDQTVKDLVLPGTWMAALQQAKMKAAG